MKTCSRALRTSDWGNGSPSNRTTTQSTQARQRRSGFEWPSQSPDLNTIEHLWRHLKIAVQQHSPANLTKLERNYIEGRENLPKYKFAKLVASFPRRLKAVFAAKVASKY